MSDLLTAAEYKARVKAKRKPRLNVELTLHIAIVYRIEELGLNEGWLMNHFPNSEEGTPRQAAKWRAMGLRPDWSDLVFLSPRGTLHCVEIKRPAGVRPDDGTKYRAGTLSPGQKEFKLDCIARGIPYAVVTSITEAEAILSHWGALRLEAKVQAA